LGNSSSVHISRWARGLATAGFEVSLISLGGKPIDGISTFILGPEKHRRVGYLTHLSAVKRLIRELNPALLHSHYATGYGLWGTYSGFHPHLVSVWGADIIDFPRSLFRKLFLRRILLSADKITATSRFLKDQTTILVPEIGSKIDVIPFGVNLPDLTVPREGDGLLRLIFIKGHRKKYGPDILLHALRDVTSMIPGVWLTMAGQGELTVDLKRLTQQLGLHKFVNFTGFIENREIPSLLAKHDIMIMPSVMESESFGVAALEAAAAGLPVIASRIGGIPEVVLDGVTGLLVKPGDPKDLADAIITLAKDKNLRDRLGQAGRNFVVRNYLWDDNIRQMATLYRTLLDNQKEKAG